jgi:hypothetical protein
MFGSGGRHDVLPAPGLLHFEKASIDKSLMGISAEGLSECGWTARPASRDARYYWLLLAEGYLTLGWFGSMLRSIATLVRQVGGEKQTKQVNETA